MGRIPAFLYNDLPWVPYQGSNISVETYGFSAGLTATENTLSDLVHKFKNMTVNEYHEKLSKLREVRFHFTYPGVVHEIEQLIHDPFGPNGGNLRCTVHPHTERCCGR